MNRRSHEPGELVDVQDATHRWVRVRIHGERDGKLFLDPAAPDEHRRANELGSSIPSIVMASHRAIARVEVTGTELTEAALRKSHPGEPVDPVGLQRDDGSWVGDIGPAGNRVSAARWGRPTEE